MKYDIQAFPANTHVVDGHIDIFMCWSLLVICVSKQVYDDAYFIDHLIYLQARQIGKSDRTPASMTIGFSYIGIVHSQFAIDNRPLCN